MKKNGIVVVVVAVAVCLAAGFAWHPIMVRYHLNRYKTQYNCVLSSDTPDPLRFRHRTYALYHCEKLIELGYWGRYIFPTVPMEQEQMQEFCELLTSRPEAEPSYCQNWNQATPSGAKGTLAIWCRPDQIDGWRQFLTKHNILKKEAKANNPSELIPEPRGGSGKAQR